MYSSHLSMYSDSLILMAALAAAILLACSGVNADALTPAELWKGFDPDALPLDVQLIDQREADGIAVKQVFFTSEVWKGVPVRVHAIYGAPVAKTNLPAVLHIHGGGGMASMENVIFWAKRGYAAASFDHMGNLPGRTIFTHWGKVNSTATYGGWGDDPKNDIYYHAAIASMRAITFLTAQPEVDPKRIGAYGISYGGTFIWLVSSLDKRLKCVVPIVGCGSPEEKWGEGQYREWCGLYNASLYAPRQTCPVLFLNASNDFNADIDNADYTIRLVNTDKRLAYEVNYNHHLEPAVANDLPLWMDAYLKGGAPWPKTPELRVSLGPDGIPRAEVRPDTKEHINEVYVRYNLDTGVPAQARFWRTVAATKSAEGNTWHAALPIMDTGATVRAYCDVYYRNGVVLSSLLSKLVPSSLGQAHATLKAQSLIDDFAGGRIWDWVWYPAGADPTEGGACGPHLAPVVNGPDGGWGIGANGGLIKGRMVVSTTKICDPAYLPGSHKRLSFRVRGGEECKLTVVLARDFWLPTQNEFKCDVELPAGEEWPRIAVAPSDFKDKDGKVLDSWDNVLQLRFEGQYPPDQTMAVARVEWTD